MANVLNRTTKEFIPSVNTPDYPEEDWIINPDLTTVAGYPSKYWDISGDTVTLKDDVARAALDAAETDALEAATKVAAVAETEKFIVASAELEPIDKDATLEARVRALELKVFGG